MRSSIKLRCGGFSIILLLIAIFNTNGSFGVTENNIQNYVAGDCISVADFIEDNFKTFVKKYNESIEDNSLYLDASYVEMRKNVINIDDNSSAIYLDFNGENGYALVGNDYSFLDFKTEGDLEYLKDLDLVYFSGYDGFVYETEFGYGRYSLLYADEEFWQKTEIGRFYDGQDQNKGEGSGKIKDPNRYINDRYGGGYNLIETKRLNNYQNVVQGNYSCYTSPNGSREGNCTLSAMFGIMRYLRDNKGMTNLPSSEVEIDLKNDEFYEELIEKGYEGKPEKIPTIYAKIREAAIGYGYKAESTAWTSINMENFYNDSMELMGYTKKKRDTYASLILVWSFNFQVKKEIDSGYPTMWNTARGQYGSHSMVVKGYKRYYKECKIWFIKMPSYKELMILNDNHVKTDIYFDLNAYSWNLGSEGFGTFLKVRDYAF